MPDNPFIPCESESQQNKFEAQLARIYEVAGCRTQVELANVLDIAQSSVSDAKRRGTIPSDWLVKLLDLRGVNPCWLKNGTGVKFLTPSEAPEDINCLYETFPPVRAVDAEIVRKVLRCFPVRDLVAELHRRKVAPSQTHGQE